MPKKDFEIRKSSIDLFTYIARFIYRKILYIKFGHFCVWVFYFKFIFKKFKQIQLLLCWPFWRECQLMRKHLVHFYEQSQ